MPKIFISYRRADSQQITSRIYDHLTNEFGEKNVFKDVDSILAGADFRGALHEATADCDVMLVVIGKEWLSIADKSGNRRLDDPRDFVRIEVESSLQRNRVRTIPLLVEGAEMPSAEKLPDSLKQLAYKHALTIHNDPVFRDDITRLINQIKGKGSSWNFDIIKWVVGAIVIPLVVAIITILPSLLQNERLLDNPRNIAEQIDDSTDIIQTEQIATLDEQPLVSVTETSTPTTTVQLIPGSTATDQPASSISHSYPCEAEMVAPAGSYVTAINQVRIRPSSTSSLSASPANPQQLGTTVVVVEKSSSVRDGNWYQIHDNNNNYLGWIEETYLHLANNCPD